MLVVSSPSGAGKTTLCNGLLQNHANLTMSISVTTRPPREGEKHGVDYYFVSRNEFDKMLKNGELLEAATVFDNFYGTPRDAVEKLLARGQDILFDVDWQGAAQLGKAIGDELCRVFVLPPSGKILENRLKGRGTDPEEVIARRMAEAAREIIHWREYDYLIVNDDLQTAQKQLDAILLAERCRRQRLTSLPEFTDNILEELRDQQSAGEDQERAEGEPL